MRSFFQLIRWQNLLFLTILLWTMEKWVAVPIMATWMFPESMPAWVLALLILSVCLVAGGGYAINDYFDIKIDRINRPDQVLVTTVFSKQQTMRIFQIMTVIGLIGGGVVAFWAHSWMTAMIFALTTGLLWFYSASYKRQLLIGNIIVAFVCALTPMLIAVVNVDYMQHTYGGLMGYTHIPQLLYQSLGAFALFAFWMTLIREIIKDLQDQVGDRELECHSLPIVLGETWTKVIVTVLIGVVTALVGYGIWYRLPFDHTWSSFSVRYGVFGLIIPLLCEIALLWAAKIPSDYRNAQLLAKLIMFLGVLFSVVIPRSL